MRIACPNCHATYDVPDAVLARGPGRVRCARCATEWVPEALAAAAPAPSATPFADAMAQAAAAPEIAAEPPPAPEPAAVEPPPPARNTLAMAAAREAQLERPRPGRRPARSPRDSATVLFAWSLSIGVVVAGLAAAYVHHADVVAAWPAAQRAYELFGIR